MYVHPTLDNKCAQAYKCAVANKYISTAEAAARNGISRRYVQKLCVDGRIDGAIQVSRDWLVPASFKWKTLTRGPKPKMKK